MLSFAIFSISSALCVQHKHSTDDDDSRSIRKRPKLYHLGQKEDISRPSVRGVSWASYWGQVHLLNKKSEIETSLYSGMDYPMGVPGPGPRAQGAHNPEPRRIVTVINLMY